MKQKQNKSTPSVNSPGQSERESDFLQREERHLTIYGYTEEELSDIIRHFRSQLPSFVTIMTETVNLVTRILLTGSDKAIELLRFKMNKFHQQLQDLFTEEIVTTEDKTVSQVLGELLRERELTVSTAESCTGGNIAHNITLVPGSSDYFLGSVVSYSNEVKAKVLKVSRTTLNRYGAVSREVAEQMVQGVAKIMQTDCAIATTGIAGPDGGTKFKPVGSVWIAAYYNNTVVAELIHFPGDRNLVIESASNHAMIMLIKLLRNSYTLQEEINDD